MSPLNNRALLRPAPPLARLRADAVAEALPAADLKTA
jgi:hypothetical protein